MDKPEIRGSAELARLGTGTVPQRDFPVQPQVAPPLDVPRLGPRSIVAPRVTFPRRPPEMALTWAASEPALPTSNPDVAFVCGLPTPELAFRLASFAARIETQVQYAGTPEAVMGLGVLSLQARMYEHLHLLQSAAGDVA